jgi:hypothetical protein
VLAAAKPVARREVDNLAAILLDHLRNYRAASVELAAQVGVDTAAPFVVGNFRELFAGRVVTAAGVVNQDVNFAELLDGGGGERVDLRGDGCDWVRAAATISAPASASLTAIARPRPRPAPVTMATLPSSFRESRIIGSPQSKSSAAPLAN